jgi:mono/diheme cytochrome c family protein
MPSDIITLSCDRQIGQSIGAMIRRFAQSSIGLILAGCFAMASPTAHAANKQQISHGEYLVRVGSCTDCHTPGHFLGKEDNTNPQGI